MITQRIHKILREVIWREQTKWITYLFRSCNFYIVLELTKGWMLDLNFPSFHLLHIHSFKLRHDDISSVGFKSIIMPCYKKKPWETFYSNLSNFSPFLVFIMSFKKGYSITLMTLCSRLVPPLPPPPPPSPLEWDNIARTLIKVYPFYIRYHGFVTFKRILNGS